MSDVSANNFPYVTTRELSEAAHVSPRAVSHAIAEGVLPSPNASIGKAFVWHRELFDQLIDIMARRAERDPQRRAIRRRERDAEAVAF